MVWLVSCWRLSEARRVTQGHNVGFDARSLTPSWASSKAPGCLSFCSCCASQCYAGISLDGFQRWHHTLWAPPCLDTFISYKQGSHSVQACPEMGYECEESTAAALFKRREARYMNLKQGSRSRQHKISAQVQMPTARAPVSSQESEDPDIMSLELNLKRTPPLLSLQPPPPLIISGKHPTYACSGGCSQPTGLGSRGRGHTSAAPGCWLTSNIFEGLSLSCIF